MPHTAGSCAKLKRSVRTGLTVAAVLLALAPVRVGAESVPAVAPPPPAVAPPPRLMEPPPPPPPAANPATRLEAEAPPPPVVAPPSPSAAAPLPASLVPPPAPVIVAPPLRRTEPPADPNRPLRLGVGSVVSAQDGTTESFLLLDHLQQNLGYVRGRQVEIDLVDAPTDADYTLSGVVNGRIDYTFQRAEASFACAVLGLGIGVPITGLGAVIYGVSPPTKEDDQLRIAAVTGTGIALTVIGLIGAVVHANADTSFYTSSLRADLTLRRGTKKVAAIRAAGAGEIATSDEEVPDLKRRLLEPVWAEVTQQVDAELNRAPLSTESR